MKEKTKKQKPKNRYGKNLFGLFALLVVGAVITAGISSAFGMGQMSEESRKEIRTAIENEDYDSWKDLMEARITEENFNQLVTHHQEREACRELREETRQAIDDADYEAYKTAVENSENEAMSEDDFNQLVEMHQYRMENGIQKGFEEGDGIRRMHKKMFADCFPGDSDVFFGMNKGPRQGNMNQDMMQTGSGVMSS